MTSFPKKWNHPAFGPCKAVPSLAAIKWNEPIDPEAANAALKSFSLNAASERSEGRPGAASALRDPRPVNVNQTSRITWATGKGLSDTDLQRIASDDRVQWAARAYRADRAEAGPQSIFTVDPTGLILSDELLAEVGGIGSIEASASIDRARSGAFKGFVVLLLPGGNSIDVANRLASRSGQAANSIFFENIPYISPVASCCCAQGSTAPCAPSASSIIPDDPYFPAQWGLQRINAPRAWPLSEGDPNVVVAVLDQGVELAHPDLNLWPISYSTITHTNDGSPVGNHGTACAGIIGGRIDNALGVSGLAGRCRVMAIATNFADTEVAEGLYYAADNGARVVSMSFGVYPSWMVWNFAIIEAALQYCLEKNVVLVAASGNENQNVSRFPGSDPRTICVGGSNRDDVRKSIGDTSTENWWGACYGPDLDVVAPCLEIPTTDRLGPAGYTPTDYDMRFNGTSSATPHVAALAGLIISLNGALTSGDVRRIISESTDKINAGAYAYVATLGKPYGTWNPDVGYGRINAERALLMACSAGDEECGPCGVKLPKQDACCESPCDPPWRSDEQCLSWYEERYLQVPLRQDRPSEANASRAYIEFRITYQHRLCILGKQHGPLLYTVTLLPGEKVTLYHSERFQQVTSAQDRFSVQITFMQFVSLIHQARVSAEIESLQERLSNISTGSAASIGGGLAGLLGLPGGSTATKTSLTDHSLLNLDLVAEQFDQSVVQASQMTHAERSVVISTYAEADTQNVTSRTLQNDNACRAVTYFVRKVVELYAVSTIVSDISYRIVGTSVPPDWHSANDIGWLPAAIQAEIKAELQLLPKVGDIVERARPISLPTDGTVYDPELAHCGSCEPERAAAMEIELRKQQAEALKLCREAQLLELELERRRLLLQKGDLEPFEAAQAEAPALTG